ncbi:MAG TPA: ATP-dependent DNA helicase [Patescibacteria group bacterium]|nr:ATP-dependent DNA helicase [Patescibacteria group bacterium]
MPIILYNGSAMPITPFESQYQKLNPEQKASVDTIDGPVMVVAGPGTGKTQVLTLRIANILQKTDTDPKNILALTFTESAAKNMRTRLIKLIGTDAYKVRIQTFHGFCQSIITEYPEYFPFELEATAVSDVEKYQIIRDLLDDPNLKALRTPGSKYHYVGSILDTISKVKSEGIDPNDFESLVGASFMKPGTKAQVLKYESDLAKQTEFSAIFANYQKRLKSLKRYDFDDMIIQTVHALSQNELLRAELEESLQYILVDEYQDTNGAQNKVVFLLASHWGERANVFVVGDPNQTIFRFQGASLENTYNFVTHFPKATVVTLARGYRCTQTVYDAAARLLADPNTPSLQSNKTKNEPICLAELPSRTLEHLFVANDISIRLKSGTKAQDIAILVKTNAQATEIADVLVHQDIPITIERQINILESPDIIQLVTLLRVILGERTQNEGRELFDVLSYQWSNIDPLLVMGLSRSAHNAHRSLQEEMRAQKLEIADKLDKWSSDDANMIFPAWIETVIKESGYLDWVVHSDDKSEKLENLVSLYSEIKRLTASDHTLNLEKFIHILDTMQEQSLPIAREIIVSSKTHVTIATVHKAKGREWQVVYIPNMIDGVWGNARKRAGLPLPEGILTTQTEDNPDADDQRLFYVALTRAIQTAVLTYSSVTPNQGKLKEHVVSQFVATIDPSNMEKLETDQFLQRTEPALAKLVSPPTTSDWTREQREWLKTLVEELPLSVSTLNKYLHSPKDFYEEVLLRVPQAKKPHFAFGTAIHKALEFHYRTYRNNENVHPDITATISVFEKALAQEVLQSNDLQSYREKGKEVLNAYLEDRGNVFPLVVSTEEGFGWRRGKILLGDIQLTGKVDRIDLLEEGKKGIRVIDYKTGQSKTINEIEGKVGTQEFSERELALPENIRGAYKRQLLFYKLLLSLDRQYKQYEIAQGVFDFVQPKNGKLVEHSFALLDNDVSDLQELIKEVMAEIRSLKFLEFI